MDDSRHRSKQTAGVIGGVLGAAIAASGLYFGHYRAQAKYMFDKVFNADSDFNRDYEKSVKMLSDHAVEIGSESVFHLSEQEATALHSARQYVTDYDKIKADMATIIEKPHYQEQLKKLHETPEFRDAAESRQALDMLRDAPSDVYSVHFVEEGGRPVTKLNLSGLSVGSDGSLSEAKSKRIFGVGKSAALNAGLDENGIMALHPDTIDTLHETSWFADAEKAVIAAEEKLAVKYEHLFRSAAPRDFLHKYAGHPMASDVLITAAIGALAGGFLLRALVPSKKVQQVEQLSLVAANDPNVSL